MDLTTERIYLSLIFDEDSLSFLSLPDPLQVPLSVNHKSQWPSPPQNQPPIQPSQIPTPIPTSTSNPTHHEVTNIQPPSPDYHLTNFLSTTQITPSTTSNMDQSGPSQDSTSAPLVSPSPQPNNLSPTAAHISLLSMSSAQPPSPLLHQSLHLLLIT